MALDAGGPQGFQLEDIRVVLDRPGMPDIEITPNFDTMTFATLAVGGFGSCSFSIPGAPSKWRQQIPHLSLLRASYGGRVLYEGQVEDIALSMSGDQMSTRIAAFGLQRLLAEVGVRRVWLLRSIDWQTGRLITGSSGGVIFVYDPANWGGVATGQFDPTLLSRIGVELKGTTDSGPSPLGSCQGVYWYTGGATLNNMFFTANNQSGKDPCAMAVQASSNGTAWTDVATHTGATFFGPLAFNAALPAGTNWVRIVAYMPVSHTGGLHAYLQVENIGVTGIANALDAAGGYYGGTILNDLLALVPGLTVGTIESGSDFTIEEIQRAVRSSILDVVSEVAGYYTREWGVWEDGRFDWITRNLDQPQWVAPLSGFTALDLTATVDGMGKSLYVIYQDAASKATSEQSAVGTSQRNPYVKTGRIKDALIQPGFAMTAASASQLAAKLVGDVASYPLIRGTFTLPARAPVAHTAHGPQPAWTIRAGDNILIPDLPTSELASSGKRDGETLFHIVTTDTDLGANTIQLTVEGQLNRSDILVARLAAVTRVIGG